MRLSLVRKPHPARVCAAGGEWAVLVGYMRVSTAEQNLALQHGALLATGIAPERIHDDTCPGAVTNHSGLLHARAWRMKRFASGSILSVRMRIISWLRPNCLIVREQHPLRAVTKALLSLGILGFGTAVMRPPATALHGL